MKKIRGRDITGKRFGRLVALEYYCRRVLNKGSHVYYWLFQCDCGEITITNTAAVISGKTKSCGCLHLDTIIKHGRYIGIHKKPNKLENAYKSTTQRCYDKKAYRYSHYGGRGIKIEWKSFAKFEKDMKPSFDRHIEKYGNDTGLSRKDQTKNFSKENCFWTTHKERQRRRINNRIVRYKGKDICFTEFSEKTGLKFSTLYGRMKYGWEKSELLEPVGYTPLKFRRREIIKNNPKKIEISKKIVEVLKTDERALRVLDERTQDIIRRRFGLENKDKATLQEIADDYHLSRERIRQLEDDAMKKIIEVYGL